MYFVFIQHLYTYMYNVYIHTYTHACICLLMLYVHRVDLYVSINLTLLSVTFYKHNYEELHCLFND